MTKKWTFILLMTLICWFSINNNYSHSNSSQPIVGHAGAIDNGELTCAKSGCHLDAATGGPNTGPGSLIINYGGAEVYEAGATYDISVTIDDPNASRFGFQMIALDESFNSTGAFISPAGSMTNIQTSPAGREYINHQSVPNPSENTYSFQWTAPATGSGSVTFWASGLAANGNGAKTGDYTYTASLNITEMEDTALEDILNKDIEIYPNPIQNDLNINLDLKENTNVAIQIMDATGKMIQQFNQQTYAVGSQHLQYPVDLVNGLYYLHIQMEDEVITKPVIIAK